MKTIKLKAVKGGRTGDTVTVTQTGLDSYHYRYSSWAEGTVHDCIKADTDDWVNFFKYWEPIKELPKESDLEDE